MYGRAPWDGIFKTTITDPEPLGKQGQVKKGISCVLKCFTINIGTYFEIITAGAPSRTRQASQR